jgi:hypothetical protein
MLAPVRSTSVSLFISPFLPVVKQELERYQAS